MNAERSLGHQISVYTLAGSGPKRLAELIAGEQVTRSAITQIVIKLERDGLVERHPDPGRRPRR